jgi:hypothetical protein
MNALTKSLLVGLLEQENYITGFYGGGFKPPTKGHFAVVKKSLEQFPNLDKLYIVIGKGIRDGISQDESYSTWNIYKKYLGDKVEIVKADPSPLTYIKDYIKSNTDHKSFILIGSRDNNDNDAQDFVKRKEFFETYGDHVEVKNIITTGGISGTKAREAAKISKEQFFKYIPSELTDEEKDIIFSYIQSTIQESTTQVKEKLNENASYSKDIDIKRKILELTKYMLAKGMNIRPLPKVKIINGDSNNAREFLGKTAYYNPNNYTIILYTEGRHPKDIVRSFSHEMIHHIQNLEDRLGDVSTTNTMEDDNLDKLEQEANLKGTMTFRNWTDSLNEKKSKDPFGLNQYARELAQELEETLIIEGRYDKLTNQISNIVFTKFKEIHDKGNKEGQFELTVGSNDEDILSDQFTFDLEGVVEITDDEYFVDGGSNVGFDDSGNEITPLLLIKFKIPQNPNWQKVSFDIKDVVRHELEHLTQDGENERSGKYMEDDQLLRDLINADVLPKSQYFKLEKEVDAMLQGLYFKSKKSRLPFKKVIDDYLDTVGLTPQEKEEILNIWKIRRKALSLPIFESEEKIMDYEIYSDMDGVLTNFDAQFMKISDGIPPLEYENKFGKDGFWELIDSKGVGYWVGMPWMPDGKIYWDYIKGYSPILLSAPSKSNTSKLGKRLWVKNNMPGTKLILAQAKDKQKYAQKNRILIDDRPSNIDQWRANGGIGILHTSAPDTIRQLKDLNL